MTDSQSVRYQPIPNNKLASRILTSWTGGDLCVLALGLLAIVASAIINDLFWIIFSASSMIVLLARTRTGYGRIYYEIYLELVGMYIDKFLGGILWQAEAEKKPLTRFLRSQWSAIPMRLTQVKAEIDGQIERYGLIEQLDRPYDYLYIIADGGAFADLEINEDTDAVATLANVTNVAILETELKAGASYLRIESPFDQAMVSQEIAAVIDPIIARPERFKLDDATKKWVDWASRNLEELRPAMQAQRATKSSYLIVVGIKRRRSMNRKGRKFTDNQLRDLPIIELGRSLVEALANEASLELKNVHVCGLAELAGIVRTSWDVAGIDKYNLDKATGLVPKNDDEIEAFLKTNGVDMLQDYLQAWPKKIVRVSTKDKYVQMDGNYLSTIRATGLPRQIRTDQARSLQYLPPKPRTWLRRAVVGESASGETETNQLVIAESAAQNWQNFVTGRQIVQHPKFATRRRELAEQAQVSSSQSVLQRFNYFWCTVGTDVEEVTRSRKASRGRLKSESFPTKVIAPTALLLDAAISGCLGINRL